MLLLKLRLKSTLTIILPFALLAGCGGGGDGANNTQTNPIAEPNHSKEETRPIVTPNSVFDPVTESQPITTPFSGASVITSPEIHLVTDVNNHKALFASGGNHNTYEIEVRRPGVFTTSAESYDINISLPSGLRMIDNNCQTSPMYYGGSCNFTIEGNLPEAAQDLTVSNHYQSQQLYIDVNATNTASGVTVPQKRIAVSVVNDPLITAELQQDHEHGRLQWRTGNIEQHNLRHRNRRLNMNVPAIQSYGGFRAVENTFPIMALKTRCANRLVYLVIQPKTNVELTSHQDDNITIKYHALISNGENTGGGTDRHPNTRAVVLNGLLSLIENDQLVYQGNTSVSAHDRLWSGPENINRLKELITTDSTRGNSTIISVLDQLNGDRLIDLDNVGVDKIITVHGLLNTDSADQLRDALGAGHSVMDIATAADSASADQQEFAKALGLYKDEVAKACYS
ncbi:MULTISPECIES: hypothetical protein [Cysteiniphilum]|uniref:hypothetical protein n=1 Tax=Cysteiniphilum TaxID=2056696 RepID=UPI00178548C0|nr:MULTISPECIES: hypothetical protein [Cysteiniphilum]